MKIKFFLLAIFLFITINSTNGTNQEILQKFALQKTLNPKQLPTTLSLLEDTNYDEVEWSILIATITKRSKVFTKLFKKLMSQITAAQLSTKIEIIFYRDACQKTVGYKRNKLLENARGKYICFIDDDDEVHANYIKMIYEKLLKNPDCVKLVGIMTYAGKKSIKRIHSIKYKAYQNTKNCLYRPPTHINPMRKSIACQFRFPEYNFCEDKQWTMEVCRSGLLKKEAKIEEPYYFYKFDPAKSETWYQRFTTERKIIAKKKAMLYKNMALNQIN